VMLAVPENGTLLSVEKDPLFAAIATKIVEYAGLVRQFVISHAKLRTWPLCAEVSICHA
jgi:predicted O-methyltransferase YrrM